MTAKRGRRGEGTWLGKEGAWRLQLGAGVVDGRRLRPSFTGRTKAEARAKAAMWRAEVAAGAVAPNRQPLERYLDRWLAAKRRRIKAGTALAYAWEISCIKEAIGTVTLDALDWTDVEQMMAELVDRGLSVRSANHARIRLGAALQDAMREKPPLVTQNAARLSRPLPQPRVEFEPLTAQEADALLDHTRGSRLHPLYVVALTTGMRQGELLGLQWSDVDLAAGTLTVRHTLHPVKGRNFRMDEPKTKRSRRMLPLPAMTVDALKDQLIRQGLDAADEKQWQHAPWDLVFRTEFGRPLDGKRLTKDYQATLAELEIPRRRFHDLRHSAATFMLGHGVELAVVSDVLGHSSVAVTDDIYAHIGSDLMRDALGRLAGGIGKSVGTRDPERGAPTG